MNYSPTKTGWGTALTIILFVTILISTSSSITSAQTTDSTNTTGGTSAQYTLLEPLPCVNGNGVNCTTGTLVEKVNFKDYVQYVFNLIIALAAVAAVFMTVWGGFMYMTSESIQKKNDGVGIIKNALGGLVLVLCSFLILRTIDPRLVEIPATLVKPLEIKVDKNNTVASFFSQISEQAAQYHVDMKGYRSEIEQSQKTVAQLELEKTTLEQQLKDAKTSGDSDKIPALEGQLASVTNQIGTEKGKVALIVGKGALDSFINTFDPTTGTTGRDFKQAVTDLQVLYGKQFEKMRTAGAQPDQLNSYSNYLRYSESILKMNEQIAKVRDVMIEYESLGLPSKTIAPLTGRQSELETKLTRQKADSYLEIKKIVNDYRSFIHDDGLITKMNQKFLDASKLIDTAQLK